MLALLIVLSMATVAFADEEVDGNGQQPNPPASTAVEYAPTPEGITFNIKKTYNQAVSENLEFIVEGDDSNPDTPLLTVGTNNTVAVNAVSNDIIVTVPSYSKAGVYKYEIKEKEGKTAGVSYTDAAIYVVVYVGYNNDVTPKALTILNTTSFIKKPDQGEKVNTFNNTFKFGSFEVTKDVSGTMANENEIFQVKVTLTSDKKIGTSIDVGGTSIDSKQWLYNQSTNKWTYTTDALNISESGTPVTISNVPVGVSVTNVVEQGLTDNKTSNGYTFDGVYTRTIVNGQNNDTEFSEFSVVENEKKTIVVKNTNNATVDTGIALDSMPYFVMLSVACVGMFLLLTKKRANREF